MTTPEQPQQGPGSAMGSGTDAGEPGEREPVRPDDEVAAAAQDDSPLPPESVPGGGGPQEDGLEPDFREP